MARSENLLLGRGELLTKEQEVARAGSPKKAPYPLKTAKTFVAERIEVADRDFQDLPADACPNDEAVMIVTMHPRYLSKSDFPNRLFRRAKLTPVGSKSCKVKPRRWGTNKDNNIDNNQDEVSTTALFVAGRRKDFHTLPREIATWQEDSTTTQVQTIEDISSFRGQEKVRGTEVTSADFLPNNELWLEVVLHNAGRSAEMINHFIKYSRKLGARVLVDKVRDVGGLTFVPVLSDKTMLTTLAEFSFLRVVRGMPTLRPFRPILQRGGSSFPVSLPSGAAQRPESKVAIFDGGIPDGMDLSAWVECSDVAPIGAADPRLQVHGLAVTSAFLFGPIDSGSTIDHPFTKVHHYRVLDDRLGTPGNLEYIDILDRIVRVLDSTAGQYDFVNISLGPQMAAEDDEVTAWTATLDAKFHEHEVIATVAVGNDGHLDAAVGLNRIQPPADGVNVIAVGATDVRSAQWSRAQYSCVGPGRSPGIRKPDGVCFGGSIVEPFNVLEPSAKPIAGGTRGTSFAAPYACRVLAGVTAHYGDDVRPLATRALLIHRAQRDERPADEVGWGNFIIDLSEITTVDDCEVAVLYQGNLPVGTHLRAEIPLPDTPLSGMVTVESTLLFVPDVDPEHPFSYTRCGLEVMFRPHSDKYSKRPDGSYSNHPKTVSFFSQGNMFNESEMNLRSDAHKWEPCIRASRRFRASSLKESLFDIYYHRREAGAVPAEQKPMPYAMIVTVRAENVTDLYNQVVRKYANILQPVRSRLKVPVVLRK